MFRKRCLIALVIIGLLIPTMASATDEFDGKWYFEAELLRGFMPPQGRGDGAAAREFRESFLNNTWLLLDTAQRRMEMAVFGEPTETDYFIIVEQAPGMLRIKPLTGHETTVLRLDEAGELQIIEQTGFMMRLRRNPPEQSAF